MLVSDAIAYERILLNTPAGGSSRWQDSQLITLTDRGQKMVVAEIRFPESRLVIPSVAGVGEYPIQSTHVIYRVYLNGQLATRIPGGIDTLEGRQIGYDDSTAQGTVTALSGAPDGAGQQQTAWSVATPLTYPFINSWGVPKPSAQPFFAGQPPRYTVRAGNLVIVPPPGGNVVITVDCVLTPDTLTSTKDPMVVPDNGDFLEAIANWTCYRATSSDKDPLARQISRDFYGDFQSAVKRLRTWKREYSLDEGQPLMQTMRAAFRIGGHRSGFGSYG